MIDEVGIRKSSQGDILFLEELCKKSFPDEDLFFLVKELLDDEQNVLSLSAIISGIVVGYVSFTKCYVNPKVKNLSLLGPLAVLPEYQRKGVGGSLIKGGFSLLRDNNICKVLVLGDPDFYKKFGFRLEKEIKSPYAIPKEWERAWQSCQLMDMAESPKGKLEVPKAWQRQELWSS